MICPPVVFQFQQFVLEYFWRALYCCRERLWSVRPWRHPCQVGVEPHRVGSLLAEGNQTKRKVLGAMLGLSPSGHIQFCIGFVPRPPFS